MKKILLIEDEVELRSAVADWLLFEEYSVLQAENGRIGIQIAFEQIPDLIISDVMMPELDGYQVLKALHARPETAVIPFIFLTALADRRELRHGMEMGADDYLTKPFTREELLSAIDSRLERQSVNQQQVDTALDELRNTILRTLPHELRTPLTGILGMGEILASNPDFLSPADLQEMGQLTLESANRLLRLIENYQYFVEIELRGDELREIGGIAEASGTVRGIGHNLAIQYDRVADLQTVVKPAFLGMSQRDWAKVVFELLDNAFKFSTPGTAVCINGWCLDADPQALRYRLSITDQGRGFRPEHMAKIGGYIQFDRQKHEQQGSGLGLAIVKRLARLYEGVLHVETPEESSGTTIVFTIPLAKDKAVETGA